jgi:hypothetical protein
LLNLAGFASSIGRWPTDLTCAAGTLFLTADTTSHGR